jgi:hypothetical protein
MQVVGRVAGSMTSLPDAAGIQATIPLGESSAEIENAEYSRKLLIRKAAGTRQLQLGIDRTPCVCFGFLFFSACCG